MTWLRKLLAMARKGLLSLAGFFTGGGSVVIPDPNPPVPPVDDGSQTVRLPLLTDGQIIFPMSVTRETVLEPSQTVVTPLVTSSQTVFAVSTSQRTTLPLVNAAPVVLAPSVSNATGSFTETWPSVDGFNWGPPWTNSRTTTGGIVDTQGGTGRLSTGTVGNYAGFAGIMTVASYGDFEMTGDYIVVGTNVVYPMIGFRSSTSWSTTHGSAQDSYWLEFKRNELGIYLYKRVGNTPTLVGSNSNFSYTTGDTIHFKINAAGSTIRVVAWKNAEAVPAQWAMTLTDTSFTSGRIYLAANGGPDTTADECRFDNLVITGGTVVTPPDPPAVTSLVRIGATWTGVRPAASMNSVISVHDTQAQHIIGFGAENGIELNPSLGVYNWGAFDPAFNEMMATNPTKPIIILCRAPGWMKSTGVTQDDAPVLPAFFDAYATLCAAVAARYTQVKYFSVWNEMKGFWNNAQNRWDYEGYTSMYNAIWTKVKAVRPDSKIGGPYVILQSGSTGTSWSHGPTSNTFPGGSHDQRQMDVMTYFRDHALGYDFLSCDGGLENQFGTQIPVDPYQQIEKLWGWWRWVRTNIHPTCELINFETYINQTAIAPWNYTQAQREDLFIELARKTALNVTGTVSYLTWFHPLFWPQVVNKSSDFVWANTESPFRAKVAAWHGSTPPPPATGTTWNVPAQGSLQAVADQAQPGDTIYVTGTNSYPGEALVITNRNNGSNPIQIIGNTGNIVRGATSGIRGFGSVRGWHFFNLNIEVGGGNNVADSQQNAAYYGEGIYIEGSRTDQGGDGGGAGNIRVMGCTINPIAGTGNIQRNGIAVWGGDVIECGNNEINSAGWNDNNGSFGGAGSGISIGAARARPELSSLSNGSRVWLHGNKIRNIVGPGTSSADRNAIILDLFLGAPNAGDSVRADRVVGTVIIEANDIANCEGRGVQLLMAGMTDEPIIVRNNIVRGFMATNLGGSAPVAAIGGYGDGDCCNITCNTNDVSITGGAAAYMFLSFNRGGVDASIAGVHGSGNIGTPVVFQGSPGDTPPAGFSA